MPRYQLKATKNGKTRLLRLTASGPAAAKFKVQQHLGGGWTLGEPEMEHRELFGVRRAARSGSQKVGGYLGKHGKRVATYLRFRRDQVKRRL